MVGDVVNLSARLMVAAGKLGADILCDHVTMEGSRGERSLDFKPHDTITVKGKKHPIAVYEPMKARRLHALRGRRASKAFLAEDAVGREQELQQLRHFTGKASQQQGRHVLLIEGEAGSGKSFLCGHLRRLAMEMDFHVMSTSIGSSTTAPFFAWRSILLELLGMSSGSASMVSMTRVDPEATLQFLERRIGSTQADCFHLLNEILAFLRLPEPENRRQMNSTQVAAALATMLSQLLRSTKKKTLVIVEDIQYLDYGSLSLFVRVIRLLPKLLVVFTLSLSSSTSSVGLKELLPLVSERIKLEPLTLVECQQLVRQQLGVEHLPKELLPVIATSQGNPFFCKELISNLLDSEYLTIDNEELSVVKTLDEAAVPSSVQDIIAGRFDALPSSVQMVLKVASVIGQEFDSTTLSTAYSKAVGTMERRELLAALARAEEGDFITRHPVVATLYYFNSEALHSVAYQRLLFAQRRHLHQTVAEALEEEADASFYQDKALYPTLAHHWQSVVLASHDNVDSMAAMKAVNNLKLAGDNSMQCSATDDAVVQYKAAMALLPHLEKGAASKAKKELQLKMLGIKQKNLKNSDFRAFKANLRAGTS